MRAVLIKISPYDPVTEARVPVYLSSLNDRVHGPAINAMGGSIWAPCLTALPTLSIEVFNGDFQAAVQTGNASFGFNVALLAQSYPGVEAMVWARAPVEIYSEDVTTGLPWSARFVGKVESFALRGLTLTLGAQVDEEPFAVDVLTQTYAGTTGAEGPADLKNRTKPLVIGWVQNVEPVLINATDSVYQFSAYGPIEEVTTLYERGAANLGAAVADHADYAALVAATIPRGRFATCLAQGMIRLGAPAYGVITADVKGHKVGATTPRLTGEIIAALALIAGIPESLLHLESLDAMDADKPYPAGLVLTDQTSLLDIAQSLALACNHQCGVSLLGQLFVTRPDFDLTVDMKVNANGSTWPQVTECNEESTSAPYWRTTMGANKSWRVHSADEIAFTAPLIAVGAYDDTVTYREGNIVDLPDGSRWLYINTVPSAGNDPPAWPTTSNAWWENHTPPLNAAGLKYADGTPIEDLKPAEPAADVTSAVTGLAEIQIDADYTGAVTTALPRTQGYKLLRNGVDETTSATWSVTVVSGTIAASIGAATGVLSLDASSGTLTSAVIQITAVLGDTERVMEVKVTKVLADAPSTGGSGGTSASGSLAGTISSATMAGIGDELTVLAGSGGNVTLAASYSFTTGSSSGSFGLYGQWYMDVTGSYVAQGSEELADNPYVPDDYTPGNGTINYTKTGLTPGNSYKFRCYMRNPSGTVTRTVSGSNSAVGS